MDIAERLSAKLATYLQFVLTIDKAFYANNPVRYETNRPDFANTQLFSHLSLGTHPLSAVEIFGRSEADAVGVVQLIAHNAVGRLSCLRQLMIASL